MTQVDHYADVRTGDKGENLILAVLPRSAEDFGLLCERLTEEIVARHYGMDTTAVTRTLLPSTETMVFHMEGMLAGGVTGSSYLDGHGKTLGYHLLTLELG